MTQPSQTPRTLDRIEIPEDSDIKVRMIPSAHIILARHDVPISLSGEILTGLLVDIHEDGFCISSRDMRMADVSGSCLFFCFSSYRIYITSNTPPCKLSGDPTIKKQHYAELKKKHILPRYTQAHTIKTDDIEILGAHLADKPLPPPTYQLYTLGYHINHSGFAIKPSRKEYIAMVQDIRREYAS